MLSQLKNYEKSLSSLFFSYLFEIATENHIIFSSSFNAIIK